VYRGCSALWRSIASQDNDNFVRSIIRQVSSEINHAALTAWHNIGFGLGGNSSGFMCTTPSDPPQHIPHVDMLGTPYLLGYVPACLPALHADELLCKHIFMSGLAYSRLPCAPF
jgi:hypothetical protein